MSQVFPPPQNAMDRKADPALTRQLRGQMLAINRSVLRAHPNPRRSMLYRNICIFAQRAAANITELRQRKLAMPANILAHYPIAPETFEAQVTPPKYRIRPYNLSRELLRLYQFAPELLGPDVEALQVLELSPGACATVELLRPLGHQVALAEFEVGPKGKYNPFHQLLGVQPRHFDGRQHPYDFPDHCADIVLCFQAIDAYGKGEADYPEVIAEFQRLARRKCVVVFNSYRPLRDPPEKIASLQARFSGHAGLRWDICPDSFLMALIWENPAQPQPQAQPSA